MKVIITLLLLLACLTGPASAHTIIVFDISTSMAGSNIATARSECEKLINNIEINKQSPLILVPFAGTALTPVHCEDRPQAIQALKALQANGGTSIAAGLNAASDLIEKLDKESALVVLITDGDDPDSEARRQSEERLGKLLKARDLSSVPTRMVVKRWGGATAALANRLQKFSSSVVDAGVGHIDAVVWQPIVETLRTIRFPDNKWQAIEVRITLPADLVHKNTSFSVTCRAPSKLSNPLTLNVASVTKARIHMPVAPGEKDGAKKSFTLDFAPSGDKSLILASVTKAVAISPVRQIAALAVSLSSAEYTSWKNPLKLLKAGNAELSVRAVAAHHTTEGLPVTFKVTSSKGLKIISTADVTSTVGKQTSIPLAFEQNSPETPKLTVTAFDESWGRPVELGRQELQLAAVTLPRPVITTMKFTVKRIDPPVWVDLAASRIRTTIHCELFVDGPMSPDNTLICSGPGRVSVKPNEFTTGRQPFSISLDTVVNPNGDERTIPFFFTVTAPKHQAIILQPPQKPLKVKLPPIKAPQLLLFNEAGKPFSKIALQSNETNAILKIKPVLHGQIAKEAAPTIGDLQLELDGVEAKHPLKPLSISLPAPQPGLLFFSQHKDHIVNIRLPSAAMVKPVQATVRVTRPAGFNVWAMRAAVWGTPPVIVLLVLFGLFRVLRGGKPAGAMGTAAPKLPMKPLKP